MSHILTRSSFNLLPTNIPLGGGALSNTTLNATGETQHSIGHIMLENPLSGSKTISAAGGGSIVWLTGSVTFSNGGSTFKVGIQDVSTASSPGQGDGTFDVVASFTGGGGGITGTAVQTSVMTSGTKTIAHGDLIAITHEFTTRAGTDSIIVASTGSNNYYSYKGLPAVVTNTGGTYSHSSTLIPNMYIRFDDGTLGWFFGTPFVKASPTNTTFNSTTGTADEYGNLVNYPYTYIALGIGGYSSFAGTSSDTELLLYSDPLGTPVVERTISVDATQLATTAENSRFHLFSTPFVLKANTNYGVTYRPTTANNISIYYYDTNTSSGGLLGAANSNCYAIRRLDNSGAFSDFNGGTAATRRMSIGLIGQYIEQGVNMCSGQVGVY